MSGHQPVLAGARERSEPGTPERRAIACLSSAPDNPYLRLLYGHLAAHGFEAVYPTGLSLRWLWRARASVGFLHFHWPDSFTRHERGPRRLRPFLGWCKLGWFAVRLVAARALGYRLVWTVHQVRPHERTSPRRDGAAARLLARSCQVLIAHDDATADRARAALGRAAAKIAVVPHGSYLGFYPEGRPRGIVRAELGIRPDAFAFLCFGELRGHKSIGVLLDAFRSAALPRAVLVVAGRPKEATLATDVEAAAAADARIKPLMGLVPEQRVAELFGACDAAVIPRSDGGTSGSLILALSMGLPVVAADTPAYRGLTGDGSAGYLFRGGDPDALRAALKRAAFDRAGAAARARVALDQARKLLWSDTAVQTAALLRGARNGS